MDIGEAVFQTAFAEPDKLSSGSGRGVERLDGVIGVYGAVLVGQTAGGADAAVPVISNGHIQGNGFAGRVNICIKGFQMEGLKAAHTHPHRAMKAGLAFGNDQLCRFQCLDVKGSGGQGDVQDGSDFLERSGGGFEHIQDFQAYRGGEGFSDFSNSLAVGRVA